MVVYPGAVKRRSFRGEMGSEAVLVTLEHHLPYLGSISSSNASSIEYSCADID